MIATIGVEAAPQAQRVYIIIRMILPSVVTATLQITDLAVSSILRMGYMCTGLVELCVSIAAARTWVGDAITTRLKCTTDLVHSQK